MSSVKFLHYRFVDERGNVAARGGTTVAYVAGEEGVSYAFANCGPNDNYNRAYGRAKDAGRLLSERYAKAKPGWRAEDLIAFVDDEALDVGQSRY